MGFFGPYLAVVVFLLVLPAARNQVSTPLQLRSSKRLFIQRCQGNGKPVDVDVDVFGRLAAASSFLQGQLIASLHVARPQACLSLALNCRHSLEVQAMGDIGSLAWAPARRTLRRSAPGDFVPGEALHVAD